jgi:hypothetical protein
MREVAVQQAFAERLEKLLFRGETFTPPTSWWVGLDVSASGSTFTEPTYTGYARVAVARSTAAWTDPTGTGQTSNVADVSFPAPTGGAGEVVRRFFLCDTASGATTVFDYFTVTPAMQLAVGSTPKIGAGLIVVQA